MPLDPEFIEAESKKNEERIARAQEYINAEVEAGRSPQLRDVVVVAVHEERPLGLLIWLEGWREPLRVHGRAFSHIWDGIWKG